jgi:hypothetical protein
MTAAKSWSRRYPPLASGAVALALAALVLPSGLTLPQTNPTQTVEYAPVPPSDETGDPPPGNVASLGLGTSGSLTGDKAGGDLPGAAAPPPAAPNGVGTVPRTKRCVGNPPRQTEDPQSPPCVGYFAGDNFGATYQGVTGNEIRILLYRECCYSGWFSKKGTEKDPDGGTLLDANKPPDAEESVWLTIARAYQRYFNDRYQTYGRQAHLFVYFARENNTPEDRRADAWASFARVHPFAVVDYTRDGNSEVYLNEMARRGVLNFGSRIGRTAKFFASYPRLIWGFTPTVEVQAQQYASLICRQVKGRPTRFSGNSGQNGKPRKFGLLHNVNPAYPAYQLFTKLAVAQMKACGVVIAKDQTYQATGAVSSDPRTHPDAPQIAAQNMAAFQQAGVTTILWTQGFEAEHGRAGAKISYLPEIILAGDGGFDSWQSNVFQDQQAWAHAWVVTNYALEPPWQSARCYRAEKEADPNMDENDAHVGCNQGNFYGDLRQLFTGIQVAGPRLNPESIDRGLHAIPPVPSSDPSLQACYYDPGDYTCVKDAAVMWWDPAARHGGTQPQSGGYRMPERGRRYLRNEWPSRELSALKRPDDPVNESEGSNVNAI